MIHCALRQGTSRVKIQIPLVAMRVTRVLSMMPLTRTKNKDNNNHEHQDKKDKNEASLAASVIYSYGPKLRGLGSCSFRVLISDGP